MCENTSTGYSAEYDRLSGEDKELHRIQYQLLLEILEACCDAEEQFCDHPLFAPFEAVREVIGERFLQLCEVFEDGHRDICPGDRGEFVL